MAPSISGSGEEGSEQRNIAPERIEKNPENPRLVFDQVEMDRLASSIQEKGILVPLIVFPKTGAPGNYVLLDGERRWRCALKLNLAAVPCYVIAPPSQIENILRMFNIHNVREEWELMPTALKLGRLMDLLGTRDTAKLAQWTGVSKAEVIRGKKLLEFPKKCQDDVLKGKMKADFFIEMYPILSLIKKHFPAIYRKYGRDELIDRFVAKQAAGGIVAVTDFRSISKIIRAGTRGVPKKSIASLLDHLISHPDLSVKQTYERSVESTYRAASLIAKSRSLAESLDVVSPETITDQERAELKIALQTLRKTVNRLLSRLGLGHHGR